MTELKKTHKHHKRSHHKRSHHKRSHHKRSHHKRSHHKKIRYRRRTKKKGFMSEKCSPKTNGDNLDFTCYSTEALHNLKNIWNARHPDVKIYSNDVKEIWQDLKKYMQKTCHKESCWLRHMCIKNDLPSDFFLQNFSPKQPKEWTKKPHTWLSSIEIEELMKQYEKKYTNFVFLGPSPIDYDSRKLHNECVWDEICNFSLMDYKAKGITKIGLIFNLDPHYKEGSHWVAMFVDIKKKGVYYFDSYGDKIPSLLMKFARTVRNQARNLGEKFKFQQPTRRHQYLSTECGMYSLHFIIKLLEDKPINFFDKRITDKHMRKLRSIYFNKR